MDRNYDVMHTPSGDCSFLDQTNPIFYSFIPYILYKLNIKSLFESLIFVATIRARFQRYDANSTDNNLFPNSDPIKGILFKLFTIIIIFNLYIRNLTNSVTNNLHQNH